MTMDSWNLLSAVIQPAIGDLFNLGARIFNGVASFTTAKAELRTILTVASDRLGVAEKGDKERDAMHDARVAGLVTPKETPTAMRAETGQTLCAKCNRIYPFGTKHDC